MANYARFTTATCTTAALVSGFVVSGSGMQAVQFEENKPVYEIRTEDTTGNVLTQYRVLEETSEVFKKIDAIHSFASNILENIEDIDPEFSKVIDENYWDLI